MNPREQYLRDRGWIMVGDAPRAWRDPMFLMSGAVSTDVAARIQAGREERVDAARVKARKR